MVIIQLTALGILLGAIIGLFIHHYITHDGKLYTDEDFITAVNGLVKSHEGIILLLVLIMVGVVIG